MGLTPEAYQFTSPNTPIVPQVLPEVQIVHELENESQWVLGGGVHSDKRHDVPVLEVATRQHFFAEPLLVDLQ